MFCHGADVVCSQQLNQASLELEAVRLVERMGGVAPLAMICLDPQAGLRAKHNVRLRKPDKDCRVQCVNGKHPQ